jgi:hypothetical protein
MAGEDRVEAAFKAASFFLSPISSKGSFFINSGRTLYEEHADEIIDDIAKFSGLSVVERLLPMCDHSLASGYTPQSRVVTQAIQHLLHIRLVLAESQDASILGSGPSSISAEDCLYQPHHRRILNTLQDLVVLEGIYPHISPGVGIPLERRVKALIPSGVVGSAVSEANISREQCMETLQQILCTLSPIMDSDRPGFDALLQDRILPDTVVAHLDLSFGPKTNVDDQTTRMHYDWYQSFLMQYVTIPVAFASLQTSAIRCMSYLGMR